MSTKGKAVPKKTAIQDGKRYLIEASSAMDDELPLVLTEECGSKQDVLARLDALDDATVLSACKKAKVDLETYAPVLVLASCVYPADKGMRADLLGSRLFLED